MITAALPLSELLARRLSLDWFEGVAIVRAVVERLDEHGAESVPELDQIDLYTGGSIAVGAAAAVKEPVRRLGQLLQALLTDADVPVQLRLIVSQATAPTPPYQSVEQFDQALAYFERPDRTEVLKALFARADAAPPVTLDSVELTLDRIAPLARPKSATAGKPSTPVNRLRSVAIGAGAVAVLSLITAAALYVGNAGVPIKGQQVSRATVAAADTVGSVVLAGVSAVSDRVGLGRFVPADHDDQPTAAGASAKAAPKKGQAPPRAGGELPVAPADTRAWEAAAYDEPYDMLHAGANAPELPAVETNTAATSADPAPDSAIYTPAVGGVTPPIGLGAQLPRQLPPTFDPAAMTRIELVIGRDGSVESARLLSDHATVLGGMFLSAVKAWQFRPAMKDGVPVRYRKMVLVSFE